MNPYESPHPVETPDDAERIVEQRIAPVAMGLQLTGIVLGALGVLSVTVLVLASIIWLRLYLKYGMGPEIPVIEMLVSALVTLPGGSFVYYAGRRLRRLDSTRWAYGACILSLFLYPMCIVTLPLGLYGLVVLRRSDVQQLLQQREAVRRGILRGHGPQSV